MPRFILASLFLIIGLSNGQAQDAYDRYTNFYSVEGTVGASFAGVGLIPTFSVYRGGHKIDAGLSIKVFDIWNDGPGILGTYLSYKHYPNLRESYFNLYFGYHNLFSTHDKGKRFPSIIDPANDMLIYPRNVLLLENMIGIGFDFQMGNNFYMFNDYSVGVALDWETFADSDTQMEVRSTGMIRIGLGYTIGSRKAK